MSEPALHLFYPENDLALARNTERYTAPPAATALRRSGQALPLWFGDTGDRFVATGINAAWLDGVKDAFKIDIDVYDRQPGRYTPRPWGWSRAARKCFLELGFDRSRLPGDATLDTIRGLSHRRTAIKVAQLLKEATGIGHPAVEVTSAEEIEALLRVEPRLLAKLPWSSSGRGLVAVDPDIFGRQRPQLEGMLRRQGSLIIEPHYDKTLDFAMLFNASGGECTYTGLSVFSTGGLGIYTGNMLAPQTELETMICKNVGWACFTAVKETLPGILGQVLGDGYTGPLGIDMMATSDQAAPFVPVIELNLRNTMGHLCHTLYERHIVPGAKGVFTISSDRRPDSHSLLGTRLAAGHINLVPPGTDFTFSVTLNN